MNYIHRGDPKWPKILEGSSSPHRILLLFGGFYLALWAVYLFNERYWMSLKLKRVSPEDVMGWTYRLQFHLRKKDRTVWRGNRFAEVTVNGVEH